MDDQPYVLGNAAPDDQLRVIERVAAAERQANRRSALLTLLSIALGAAVGANLRYGLSTWAAQRFGTGFPYGTMIINVLGSFLIGLILSLAATRPVISVPWQRLIVTGLLGGFTTFSSFSYETYVLLADGNWRAAGLNMVGSVGLAMAAVILGAGLGRLLP